VGGGSRGRALLYPVLVVVCVGWGGRYPTSPPSTPVPLFPGGRFPSSRSFLCSRTLGVVALEPTCFPPVTPRLGGGLTVCNRGFCCGPRGSPPNSVCPPVPFFHLLGAVWSPFFRTLPSSLHSLTTPFGDRTPFDLPALALSPPVLGWGGGPVGHLLTPFFLSLIPNLPLSFRPPLPAGPWGGRGVVREPPPGPGGSPPSSGSSISLGPRVHLSPSPYLTLPPAITAGTPTFSFPLIPLPWVG